MIPEYYEFQNSVKILSGKNALENIAFELKNHNAARPAILTGPKVRSLGLLDPVTAPFEENGIAACLVYEDIPADSSVAVCNDIAKAFNENSCDSIIAVGGGSIIDTAKGVALVLSQEADDILKLAGSEIITRKNRVPFIAVPTTAGTGSEATIVAVIANPDENGKMGINKVEDKTITAPAVINGSGDLPPAPSATDGSGSLPASKGKKAREKARAAANAVLNENADAQVSENGSGSLPPANVKMEFLSYNLLPDVAVLDARTTESLPPKATASTGMDALCHAIEAYTGLQKNPLSDAYAVAAIELIRDNLLTAVQNPKNAESRLAMANAALMAGVSFSNSMVGLVHAIGHACGGICHVPHGDAIAILLPHCMSYNLDVCALDYGKLLPWICGEVVYTSTAPQDRGARVVAEAYNITDRLSELCGLPLTLSECGVTEDSLELIAEAAINDGAILMNRKSAGFDDIMGILSQAM